MAQGAVHWGLRKSSKISGILGAAALEASASGRRGFGEVVMSVMKVTWARMLLLGVAAAVLGGCGAPTTETGYQPKRLGMSGPEVRSLYAPAFSPDSKPQQDNSAGGYGRHPGI